MLFIGNICVLRFPCHFFPRVSTFYIFHVSLKLHFSPWRFCVLFIGSNALFLIGASTGGCYLTHHYTPVSCPVGSHVLEGSPPLSRSCAVAMALLSLRLSSDWALARAERIWLSRWRPWSPLLLFQPIASMLIILIV